MCVARPDERGFSLLEAVIALTIVSLGVVGAVTAFAAELRAAGRARVAVELEALASEQLSESILLPAAALRPLPDSLTAGRFAPPFERYAWTRVARPLRDQPDLVQIVVEVTGTEGHLTLETRLYRPLPGSLRR